MTQDEFNALKPGDKVRNGEGQIAEIVASGPHGHSYQWNGAGPVFNLFAAGNMWRGFSVVEPDAPEGTAEGADEPRCFKS
jgi:hypothetical protein